MQVTRPNIKSNASGFALAITLVLLGIMLIIFASMYGWVNSNAIVTARNNQYNMSQNAAESAVESVVGKMDRDFIYGILSSTNVSSYTSMPLTIPQTNNWPVQYIFSSTNGTTNTVDVVFSAQNSTVAALNSQYSGLSGMSQGIDIYAKATPIGQRYNVPATVHESLSFAYIPLFQFAIFYNVNLEIDPGAAMTIGGPVFCNQNIWEGSTLCTFSSTVTAVGTNAPQTNNPFATAYDGSGASTFSGGSPVNHADALVMPIGTNNSPSAILGLLNLPPDPYFWGDASTYTSNGMAYPANAADIVVSNFYAGTNFGSYMPKGTNFVAYFQDAVSTPALAPIPYDYYIIVTTNSTAGTYYFVTNYVNFTLITNATHAETNIYYAGYSWLTNVAFYDWREGWNSGRGPAKAVQAVQIDMNLLNKWFTNSYATNNGITLDATKVLHTSAHMASAYVYNDVPLTTSQLPAVRVVNGGQLPRPGNASGGYSSRGFSVATPFPLYVWKDYNCTNNGLSALGSANTANTLPAALMADSITILSDSWNDTNTIKNPAAGTTTVNAAMLEGIVASNPNISGNYSGGVENFMRLLENWTGKTLTYNGSIIVLFYSQYATNSWQAAGTTTNFYYNPPSRNWAFDLNFKTATKLPPLTPCSKAMIRGNWFAHQ